MASKKVGCLQSCLGLILLAAIGIGALFFIAENMPNFEPESAEKRAERQAEREAKQRIDDMHRQLERETEAKEAERTAEELDKALADYIKLLQASGFGAVTSVGFEDKHVIVTVNDNWHLANKQIRLQATQDLLSLWQAVRKADGQRMRVVDRNGNRVGGTGLLGDVYVID